MGESLNRCERIESVSYASSLMVRKARFTISGNASSEQESEHSREARERHEKKTSTDANVLGKEPVDK